MSDRPPPASTTSGWRHWTPWGWAQFAFFVVLGLVLSRVLPSWAWGTICIGGYLGSLWWFARQNRRRAQNAGPMPPEYRAPADGGSPQ